MSILFRTLLFEEIMIRNRQSLCQKTENGLRRVRNLWYD